MKPLLNTFRWLFAFLVLMVASAQPTLNLVGTWQGQVEQQGYLTEGSYLSTYVFTFREDGTYRLEIVETGYVVDGTWQLTGSTLAQQWYDSLTGSQQAVSQLEILDDNTFKPVGTDTVYTRTSVVVGENPLTNNLGSLRADATKLLGTWHAENDGQTILMTMNNDGRYTFEVRSQNYTERGTWQFDGVNFSQQWQDGTGSYRGETYELEFTSATTFVMSGGNLSTPFTFTKGEPSSAHHSPQTATVSELPRAGDYLCSVITVSMTGTTSVYSPTTGITLMPTPSYTPSPSVLGTLTLDDQGNYTLLGLNERGTYTIDPNTNALTFAGVLANLPVRYDGHSFVFTYSDSEGSEDHTCSRATN